MYLKKILFFTFRLNTDKRNGAAASFFIQAKPGTKYETIYKTNMDDSSFNEPAVSINKAIQMSNQAYFGRLDQMSAHHECEVNKPFQTKWILTHVLFFQNSL